MYKKLLLSVLFLSFLFATTLAYAQVKEEVFTCPAEFEKQDGVWLLWPTYENKKGFPTEEVTLRIIKEITPYEKINLGAQDEKEIQTIKQTLKDKKISSDNVNFYVVPHNDIWTRDMGPVFIKSPSGKLKIVDLGFNMWGYEDPNSEGSKKEEQVDRIIAGLLKLPTVKANLISESGNFEFNGKGTLVTCEAVELQRNPGMTRDQIEKELKRVYNLKKIIWVKEGVYEDDLTFKGLLPDEKGVKDVYTVITTGGHIDEYVRFVNPNTLLVAEVSEKEAAKDPVAKENKKRMEDVYKTLKEATDQDGKPFNIVRMPMPDTIYDTLQPGDGVYDYIKTLKYEDGSKFPDGKKVEAILAASYLNFLITNKVVLGQSYWKQGRSESVKAKDEEAKKILQSVFPDKTVVMINAENVNIGGGGIHCITYQQPAVK